MRHSDPYEPLPDRDSTPPDDPIRNYHPDEFKPRCVDCEKPLGQFDGEHWCEECDERHTQERSQEESRP